VRLNANIFIADARVKPSTGIVTYDMRLMCVQELNYVVNTQLSVAI
jgi:hypothetical protein